ncbi:MAG: methylmalonyl Co-A mutase-associated GTPase MeaB [Alphaproteobacteria bacterium]|nr:methylmalonyl Co-A mutase-associated GTPase MeaB [Alphaproteobacteria bacterium]
MTSLADSLLSRDRHALARAITLVESTRADHRAEADALLAKLLPHAGKSIRVGITGTPGVGKSTFIEALGLHAIAKGHRVAVLAVDPSSRRGGGAILGDKTRMPELTRSDAAFIRPSPSGGTLGGVARRTAEAILVCEAAGFDVVLVETVGVGQSETAVADMTDLFLLLLQPHGGDELQGIKRGVMELADILAVNKADGENVDAAGRAQADYANAIRLLRPPSPWWTPAVLQCSALTGKGVPELWDAIARFRRAGEARGAAEGGIAGRRARQARARWWTEVGDGLMEALKADRAAAKLIPALEAKLDSSALTPGAAARALLAAFRGKET